MTAISQSLGDSIELFIPTPSNIAYAFEGIDEIDGPTAINAAEALVQQHILYKRKLKDGKECFAPLMSVVDMGKKTEYESQIDKYTTTKFVEDAGFNIDDAVKIRPVKYCFNLQYAIDLELYLQDLIHLG